MNHLRSIRSSAVPVSVTSLMILAGMTCGPKHEVGEKKPTGEAPDVHVVGLDVTKDMFEVPDSLQNLVPGGDAHGGGIDWAAIDSLRQNDLAADTVSVLYRVQLFASQYYSEAGYEREVAGEIFDEPVYLKYDVPYYKVLLGNCVDESSGNKLLSKARSLGYDTSWLVSSPPDSIYYQSLVLGDSLEVPADSAGSSESQKKD
jgi:hypothetical protein